MTPFTVSSVAKNDKDGHELKLGKFGPTFFKFSRYTCKKHK